MASLQSSCTVLFSSNVPNPRICPSLSSKPYHLLPNARRSQSFHVSCNGGAEQKPSSGGKVDRRNMLLGLGGLYGAASVSNANADPIPAPDFSACQTEGAFDIRSKDPLFVNCCPPASSEIFHYVAPPTPVARVRRAAQNVKDDREFVAKYNEGIRRMKYLDVVDPDDPRGFTQQANIHCAYCNGPHNQPGYGDKDILIHGNWLFFPFHRWYIYFFERILGSLIGDPTFALPYWNWDNPPGMMMPEIFDNPCSSLYDPNRNQNNRRPTIVDLSSSQSIPEDQRIRNNLSLVNTEMAVAPANILDFMGVEYRAGFGETVGPGTVERGSHTSVHRLVGDPREKYGENMGNFYSSARDPIFYSHHANVDRMWTLWPVSDPQQQVQIQDPDYLDSAFLFYDENKRLMRVKVRDCLNHRSLGYVYEPMETPWKELNLVRTTATAQLSDLSKGVDTADKLLPLTLSNTVKVLIPKTSKGKAAELLVLEDMVVDHSQYVHFDVFINDDLGDYTKLDRGEFAGTYKHLPHTSHAHKDEKSVIRFDLTNVYHNINIADADESVVVTIVPKSNGQNVTIGGIKIVKSSV